ncbi:hypothetical protein PBI_AN9_41 [Mycobacterium phage AN9]|uniref:hypothetical protein n=1 Tax=Mycobacterium phage Chy5 TaxID=1327948 RepID=UPI00032B35A6|nr:hypothetical protein M178_gp34 [Mycobacterium phage Chy5]YP_008060195.1 hypothetical protein M179_gp35 [Mycobacterium phage Chy4]APC46159.1 hypothetical protein PBI_STARSTUFF_41 [Mycobacterium phage StarStuff]QJD51831.1 hypothetical protein PBI_VC3_41 [Mycobacterium phage VC3]QJD51922.1 hypothetical protein PBI_VA6_38 [Mycobacterium phage VA6]QJD52504.1 hypothetical protein PBI_ANI8_41 [Mycobacterium phage ANI8]QJD52596.1 hypothetical protein PBI_AN9_41 [Mycobacterium phage AN9]QJD52688.1
MKTLVVLLLALAFVLGLSACDGGGSAPDYTGPNGVIFVPAGGGVNVPIFF